jgi:hypothetical protein
VLGLTVLNLVRRQAGEALGVAGVSDRDVNGTARVNLERENDAAQSYKVKRAVQGFFEES